MNVKLKVLSTAAAFFIGQAVLAQKKSDTLNEKEIEEVVVVAYGKQKKATVTGSNLQIDAKKIEDRPISNILTALDGGGAGIQVAAGSGQPGSGPSIRIRGNGSYLGGSEPLYVVDGAPMIGGIGSLNPQDIETLNILKDAAATSLYGSAAANGVVLITTKKGKRNQNRISLNSTNGIVSRFVPEYDRIGAGDYYVLAWEAMRNGRRVSNPTETVAASNLWATNNLITGNLKNNVFNVPNNQLVVDGVLNPNATLKYNDFDWAAPLVNTGFRTDHTLSLAGGGDKTTYYTSLGYMKEEGYITKSDYERLNLRINVDSQVKDWFKVGTSLNGTFSYSGNAVDGVNNNAAYINPYNWTRTMGPIYSPYQHDPITGERMYDANGNILYDLGVNRGADAAVGRNIVWETLLNDNTTRAYIMNAMAYGEIKFMPELTLRINGYYNNRNTLNKTYTNKIIGDAIGVGAAARTLYYYQDYTFNQLLTYDKQFGSHGLTVLLGHENQSYKYDYIYGYKRNQVLDDFYELDNFITNSTLSSSIQDRTKESYFGRINYNYQEKYLVEASIRRDASSRFGEDFRWNNFWAFGAGWVISKENFLKDSKIINNLKLRGSYGEIGNDDLGINYAYKSLFDFGYNNGTEPGILFSTLADPTITWETKEMKNIGLDFGLLNNRIRGTFEVYDNGVNNLLFPNPIPVNAGVPNNSYNANLANMSNKGFEITIGADIIKSQNFTWSIDAFGSKYKNTVNRMNGVQKEIISGTKKIMEGQDMYAFWLRTWYGVDPTDGAPLYVLDQTLFPSTTATDVRTVNGVLVTTNQNKALYQYHGSAIPDFFGSFSSNLRFKNWDLSASFNYQFGGKIYDTNYAALMNGYPQGAALSTEMLTRWTTPGQITNVPALNSTNAAAVNAASSRWLVDASYVMLRNASLGYTFNKDIVKDFGLNSFKLFVSGENLWLSSKRKGLEPYQSFNGTTSNRYAPARVISFGLMTTF